MMKSEGKRNLGKVIYLSGPIGNGHTQGPRQTYQNVRRGEELMYILMKKGWTVICPHLSYHAWLNWPEDMPWERWIEMDMDFVERSDAFFRMTEQFYGTSKGADREEIEAKRLNKTIYYKLEDVPTIDGKTGKLLDASGIY